MAAFTSKATGDWAASGQTTWNEVGVPGDGDTVTLSHTVTVSTAVTVGTSGAAATVAISIAAAGRLTVQSGGELIARGDVSLVTSALTTDCLVVDAGGTFTFDGASGVRYRIVPTGAITRIIRMNGLLRSDFTRSGLGGQITFGGSVGPNLVATSTAEFRDLGDGAAGGEAIKLNLFTASYMYDVQGALFTRCGGVNVTITNANAIFRHRGNKHVGSLTDPIGTGCTVAIGTAVREIAGNVFDRRCGTLQGGGGSSVRGISINDNYFDDTQTGFSLTAAANAWASHRRNFIRLRTDTSSSTLSAVGGDHIDNYYVIDGEESGDVHTGNPTALLAQEFSDNIHETAGALMFQNNDGWVFTQNTGSALQHTLRRNLMLPCANGRGGGTLFTTFYSNSANTFVAEHNTAITQLYVYQAAATGSGILPDRITSWKDNLAWDESTGTAWIDDAGHAVSGATTDIISPAGVANNARWNLTETVPASTGLTNQGNGYVAKFSSTPGGSDIEADPQFYDKTRNMPSFALGYLGATASRGVWSNATTYAVGDTVTRQVSGYYGNRSILYRCITAHDSSANEAADAPGSNVSWRFKWEFGTLQLLRDNLYAGTSYTDSAIGVTAGTVIQALMAWVRTGFAPTNEAYRDAASDGGDIGAVPMGAPAAGGSARRKFLRRFLL